MYLRVCKRCCNEYRTDKKYSEICPDCVKDAKEIRLKKTLGWIVA